MAYRRKFPQGTTPARYRAAHWLIPQPSAQVERLEDASHASPPPTQADLDWIAEQMNADAERQILEDRWQQWYLEEEEACWRDEHDEP